ncbi:hypothetical protein L3V79_03875 [Thiotrichales bacterium 19S9-12]|nr:hypothetical protein [Thiotrichales bacterium 19S9-11]MCF6811495.1 hypothetical protein [Thiotrichales bacterium 19S9-12]
MNYILKHVALGLGLALISNAYAFDISSASGAINSANQNSGQYVDKLINLGIADKQDQIMWSNFVNNCMLPDLSQDKMMSLAKGGTNAISDYVSSFTPSSSTMTMAYDKLVSCKDAKPMADRLLSKLTAK